MHKITISPVTRANGVGTITVMLQGNRVVQARSETCIFRGFEITLKARDPWDAPYFTQRICGICSSFHAPASCHAIGAAAKVKIPSNGILLRNIITGLDLLQNHIRHFYLLALRDWVSPPRGYPFTGGYTRDFRLSEAHTAMFHEHYWLGVDHARLAHEALALVGGKAPHNHGIIPGWVSLLPNDEVLRTLEERIGRLKSFIEEVYLPDVLILKGFYPDYLHIDQTSENYLSFGLFAKPNGGWHFPPGATLSGRKEPVDFRVIRESVAFSWFSGEGGEIGAEDTVPDISRPGAYTFVKAPRYNGFACEGGPLARDRLGTRDVKEADSVMARHEARAREHCTRPGFWRTGSARSDPESGSANASPYPAPAGGWASLTRCEARSCITSTSRAGAYGDIRSSPRPRGTSRPAMTRDDPVR